MYRPLFIVVWMRWPVVEDWCVVGCGLSLWMATSDLVLFLMSLNLSSKAWHIISVVVLFACFGIFCRSQILYTLFVLLLVDQKDARSLNFVVLELLAQSVLHFLEIWLGYWASSSKGDVSTAVFASSGVDVVSAVGGRACADVDLHVTAVVRRAGGGLVVVLVVVSTLMSALSEEALVVVGVVESTSASPQSEGQLVVVLMVASTSPQSETQLVVASTPTSPQKAGRAGGGGCGAVDADLTAVAGRAGGGGLDADVTAVGRTAGGGGGAAVSSDIDVVVSGTALVVEVVVGSAPTEEGHGHSSTGYRRQGSWGRRLPGLLLPAAEEGGRVAWFQAAAAPVYVRNIDSANHSPEALELFLHPTATFRPWARMLPFVQYRCMTSCFRSPWCS